MPPRAPEYDVDRDRRAAADRSFNVLLLPPRVLSLRRRAGSVLPGETMALPDNDPPSSARAPVLRRLDAFSYLTAEKTPLYRAIMRVFLVAKDRFALHLRPTEVVEELRAIDTVTQAADVDAALKQLREWGNLRADPDTADVATVEEFYRQRLLFALTSEGEAAERAVALYYELIVEPGELQTTALADIREFLAELEVLAAAADPDEGKLHRALEGVRGRFEDLSGKARTFMAGLQRAVDLHGANEAFFLAYKERLIEYIERFLRELQSACIDTGALLRRMDEPTMRRVLAIVARREIADRIDASEQVFAGAFELWLGRWDGIRRWFLGDSASPSQAEILRSRARSAIPALLLAAEAINERRFRRVDRFNDFRALARWFAATEDDHAAHRLWRAAFALGPARHLWVNDESRGAWDDIGSRVSWLEAPPMRIAPRLRLTGRAARPGAPRNVVDRSDARAKLEAIAREELAQIAAARAQLVTSGPTLLSAFGRLDRASFALLLDLLGDALANAAGATGVIETVSSDGGLEIILSPAPGGGEARIKTVDGVLTSRDYLVQIVELGRARSVAEAAQ